MGWRSARALFGHFRETCKLITPENTITHHDTLCWLLQKFASALFSVSLEAILTPKRNWRQCLCKFLEWLTKSVMIRYGIFWRGQRVKSQWATDGQLSFVHSTNCRHLNSFKKRAFLHSTPAPPPPSPSDTTSPLGKLLIQELLLTVFVKIWVMFLCSFDAFIPSFIFSLKKHKTHPSKKWNCTHEAFQYSDSKIYLAMIA